MTGEGDGVRRGGECLYGEVRDLIARYRQEFVITPAEIIGILTVIAHQVSLEALETAAAAADADDDDEGVSEWQPR